MHMSLELDYQSLPVKRALRIRERMQLDSPINAHSINPLERSPRESREEKPGRFERQDGTKLYWSKVDIVLDDDAGEPHFCTSQP
jgi:hypothetical protein